MKIYFASPEIGYRFFDRKQDKPCTFLFMDLTTYVSYFPGIVHKSYYDLFMILKTS